jgi:hypothetical protein
MSKKPQTEKKPERQVNDGESQKRNLAENKNK